ncbi:secreted RxLR effector protein 161-like [Xenia sp. Carnegie-2017]|uniref:secreted RxLR effector protein 161-like n=1 Tax=Xenia sp. Carnegie-2017 TaxID=2897299 RepID=UPI001F04687D|nr:secreted RxLR effector protein 161-like [Xenia sp. Carnegie-2017]
MIGCLTYVSTATRPDIAASIGVLSQFMSDPSKTHFQGVKRVLRYIKGTISYGLKFSCDKNDELHGYSDADYAGNLDDRRSTSGYVFKLANSTISWSSKKQSTVARSTTEAEYVALSQATQEVIWLRRLLSDLGSKPVSPTTVHEDNQGAIEIARNPKFHNRTKHIDVAYHFVRERILSKEVKVCYCPSKDMIADIMTKGLSKDQFQKLRNLLNVQSC